MPHSLRAKLSGLRYKGLLTDKDYQRLQKALDIEKGVQDAIAEIWDTISDGDHADEYLSGYDDGLRDTLDIIRKHTKVGDPE